MIKNILKAFASTEVPTLNTDDARIALAALMVRIARSDGDYAQIEISMIDRVLATRFDLDTDATAALRSEAEILEAQAPDNVRFTRVLKSAVPYEERSGIVEALWSVVLSDGQRDYQEDGFMRLVSSLLGVNDRDSAFARQRAQKNNG